MASAWRATLRRLNGPSTRPVRSMSAASLPNRSGSASAAVNNGGDLLDRAARDAGEGAELVADRCSPTSGKLSRKSRCDVPAAPSPPPFRPAPAPAGSPRFRSAESLCDRRSRPARRARSRRDHLGHGDLLAAEKLVSLQAALAGDQPPVGTDDDRMQEADSAMLVASEAMSPRSRRCRSPR